MLIRSTIRTMKSLESTTITLNAMLSGDREGLFRFVWQTYRTRLYYYLTEVMRCPREEGEDLLQEVMMKVHDNLDRYRAGLSFNAWIYAIARNHCIDYKRKMNARPCGEEMGEMAGTTPDPFEEVCSGEVSRAVRASLDALDDDDREMAYLRYFEGLRYRSIGAVTGMNVNSVKTRMRAVEARLRRELKGWL